MKKEVVSVMKPHKSKSSKIRLEKNPKKNTSKIEKRVAIVETRGNGKAKIVDEQKVDFNVTLKYPKNPKNVESTIINQPKYENNEKFNGVVQKIKKTGHNKMAAMSKDTEETRVELKKKLKIDNKESIKPLKKLNKIGKVEIESETTEIESETAKIKTEAVAKPKIKKKLKAMSKKKMENVGDVKMTKAHVLNCIIAVQQLARMKQESKKTLLCNESNPILLQVECIKIAKTPRRNIRPFLPHQLAGPLDEVALFVSDLERGRGRDYEKTVDHWETIFREKGVDCIKEIIPINRVKTEYRQFEMQRKLAMSFDYFLADGRICGHLTHLLGKNFFKRKSPPTPVKLDRNNLKAEMNFAFHKTCMEVHSFGNSHTMQVGIVSMDAKKVAENIWAACEELKREYPGGWNNIRSIRIKTTTSRAIPIYMSLVSKNNVPTPIVKPKRPRAYETVEGELTTVPGGAHVKVTPEGRIYVKRLKDYGDPEIKEEDDDEDEEFEIKQEPEDEQEKSDEESDEQ